MIYHICRRGEAEKAFAAGFYAPDSLQTEGFIHFSTAAQVVGVANRFYAAEPDLVLLTVDDTNAENSGKVKFEAVPDSDQAFPHYYGPLPMDRVLSVLDLPLDAEAGFLLPEGLTVGSGAGDPGRGWRVVIDSILDQVRLAIAPDQLLYRIAQETETGYRFGDIDVDFSLYRTVNVLAIGKAARRMASALGNLIEERIDAGLIVSKTPFEMGEFPPKYRCFVGSHPDPTEASVLAGEAVLEFAGALNEKDLLIVLISGGGSSLAVAPAKGVSLAEIRELNRRLLASGASIHEINEARKRVDRLKGGGVARAAGGARILNLILSDVIGNDLATIASGPTVLAKEDGGARIESLMIGDVGTAIDAAAKTALGFGFEIVRVDEPISGEAREVGKAFAERIRSVRSEREPGSRPVLILRGGESTVTLRGDGFGGRNLETALGAVETLSGLSGVALVTFATDGEDGPTDAAGAIVTGDTARPGVAADLKLSEALERNDSYRYFEAAGGLIRIGSTGSNVNDLLMGFIF